MEMNININYVIKEVFKVELGETSCEGRRWMELAHARFRYRTLLLAVLNIPRSLFTSLAKCYKNDDGGPLK
jgi:hypothetical protein